MKARRLSTLKPLRFLGGRAAFWLGFGAFLGLVLSGVETSAALLIQLLLQKLKQGPANPLLPSWLAAESLAPAWIAGGFLLLALVRSSVMALINHSANLSNEIVGLRLRLLLFHDFMDRQKGFLSLSEIQFKYGSVFPKAVQFCYTAAAAIPNLVQLSVLFLVLLKLDWRTTLAALAALVMIAVPTARLNRRIRRVASEQNLKVQRLNRQVTASVKNYFFLNAMGLKPRVLADMCRNLLQISHSALRISWLANTSGNLPTALAGILVSCLIFAQLQWTIMGAASFIAFLYLFMRLGQSLGLAGIHTGQLNSNFPQFQDAVRYFFTFDEASVARAVQHLDEVRATGSPRSAPASLADPLLTPSGRGPGPEIKLDSLTFRYAKQNVIHGLSLKVPAGSILGIQGASGAGKSTLLALVLGILDPSEGSVTLDDQAPRKYLEEERNPVGYVGPEPYLIEGTIRENLLFGLRSRYEDKELVQLLQATDLWSEFTREGKDLEFKLSEFGEGLSAGQKQRLAIARALLAQPPLLILDEATSNLDSVNEDRVMKLIQQFSRGMTAIIVSHRPRPLEYAQQVITLGV